MYTAAPIEIGEATCAVKNFIEELNQKFDDAIADLPEILQWLIFPSRTAQKKVVEKLKPELRKAGLEIVGFLTDKTISDFLDLLSDPSNANRDRLNGAYSGDTSGKNLLRFNDVASMVDADVALSNNRLDPAAFAALKSAVVLAKLSLLQPGALNQLIADKVGVGYDSARYGTPVYPPHAQDPEHFPMPDQLTTPRAKVRPKTQRPRLHKVILLNDDYTPRDFVVTVLKGEFRMTADQAYRVMITAHRRGVCVVAVFTKDVAETKATRATETGRANGYPLQFTTEPEE